MEFPPRLPFCLTILLRFISQERGRTVTCWALPRASTSSRITQTAGRNVLPKMLCAFRVRKWIGERFSATSPYLRAFFNLLKEILEDIHRVTKAQIWFMGHISKSTIMFSQSSGMCLLRIYFCQCRMLVAIPDSVVVSILPCGNKGCPVVRYYLFIICQVNIYKLSWMVASRDVKINNQKG